MVDDELRALVAEERERRLRLRRVTNKAYYLSPKGRAQAEAYMARQREKRRIAKGNIQAPRPKPDTCELCHAQATKIVFDHHHASNTFRGWLCNNCNLTIGLVNDDADLLIRMAEYIRAHKP